MIDLIIYTFAIIGIGAVAIRLHAIVTHLYWYIRYREWPPTSDSYSNDFLRQQNQHLTETLKAVKDTAAADAAAAQKRESELKLELETITQAVIRKIGESNE